MVYSTALFDVELM